MSTDVQRSGYHSEIGSRTGGLASKVSLYVRTKMYWRFAEHFPNPMRVLDVGVTSESVAPEANYFEEMFPYKDRITAVGIEDAGYLEKRFPGLKFVRVREGERYPFADGAFDVAFSNAVIEHIVDDGARTAFVAELCRVARAVYLTTPCRFFPIEPHTGVPFLHFLAPRLFYALLDRGWFSAFYNSRNLRLLSRRELERLAAATGRQFEVRPVRFFGFISNWTIVIG